MLKKIVAVIFFCVSTGSAYASPEPKEHTGTYFLNPCKDAANYIMYHESSRCLGAVNAISAWGYLIPPQYRFCTPPGALPVQQLRIIVKYLEDNPTETHRSFYELAAEALHKAWPCK